MSRRRRKGLSPEDRAVWERFVSDAEPLRPGASAPGKTAGNRTGKAAEAPPAEAAEPARPAPEIAPPEPRTLRLEGRSRPAASATSLPPAIDALDPARGLDRRTADRLRRGRRAPEARLDLHGMTADRAHAALARFIRMSRAQGKRCVLVVTGKGGRRPAEDAPFMPDRTGVLRHSAPLWLGTPPLSHMIVGVYAAHRSHGGDGALYVYLRKSR